MCYHGATVSLRKLNVKFVYEIPDTVLLFKAWRCYTFIKERHCDISLNYISV